MRERGILFSALMVNRLLDGMKSQTRRLQCHFEVGDHLYVKERWRVTARFDQSPPRAIPSRNVTVFYAAGGTARNGLSGWETDRATFEPDWAGTWRSSLFMPKWASRIWLEVTSVSKEMLFDLTERDAIAEGVEPVGDAWRDYLHPQRLCATARDSFQTLWESLHGEGSWNPEQYVWRLAFRDITGQRLRKAA